MRKGITKLDQRFPFHHVAQIGDSSNETVEVENHTFEGRACSFDELCDGGKGGFA
jgi:hypothetical protein